MQCPTCGHDNLEKAKYCNDCGVRLEPGVVGEPLAATTGSGSVATSGGVSAGESGVAVKGDVQGHVIIARDGARVYTGDVPVAMTAVERASAMGRYLAHVIGLNRYLQLQGIRSQGRTVDIELDRIYIRLRATRRQKVEEKEQWLGEELCLAPGERHRLRQEGTPAVETVTIKVEEALAEHPRLVVLGDPGSGKTTLLRYLALLYAKDLAEDTSLVREQLGLDESGRLPVLLPLRKIAAFLSSRHPVDDGIEGHARLLDFLLHSLEQERIVLPPDFFDARLTGGEAVILLDGLDEVADPDLRQRVSRLVESFVRAYAACRYVVTSRIVGYVGTARLGEAFITTTVRDFSLTDVEQFLTNWHRMVVLGQMGPCEAAECRASEQTCQLMQAIEANDRIRELAINPLLLTVIAMVHRDRVKLPDRRAELYSEAVDVLLGKWDEGKGVRDVPVSEGRVLDVGDKRVVLQSLALHMHERELKEIGLDDLKGVLRDLFSEDIVDRGEAANAVSRQVAKAVERFLRMIEERTGLLVARGEGAFGFSHLTFQEYLAALAVADREDYVAYTLRHVADPWWREVILLEAGHLSTQGKERTTRLITSIADCTREEELFHNLVLAAECVRDVRNSRVLGNLELEIQKRLKNELLARQLESPQSPPAKGRFQWVKSLLSRGSSAQGVAEGSTASKERRIAAVKALARVSANRFWSPPYGEPEWALVPAGEFWMGSDVHSENEKPKHRVLLDAFRISRVPITQAQYRLFVEATAHEAPPDWEDGRPPRGMESHPVINVSWHDAMAYCRWLSEITKRRITLPSEAQWEKAARGDQDARRYPWGDPFDLTRCNSSELGLGETTPEGIFSDGASPYGCLDMAGNVWEWTRSLWGKDWDNAEFRYPYAPEDGRESTEAPDEVRRVLRGGSFHGYADFVRCAFRFRNDPFYRLRLNGFRVVASPISVL